MNNHRKDVQDSKAITFKKNGHRFNEQATFMITDRLANANLDKEILKERIIQRENFWIQKLETLYQKGLNQELSMWS